MLGLKFEDCNDFLIAFSFHDCVLNYSSFYGLKLKNQLFSDCKLIEVDFTEADLTEADLDTSDLERATFYETNLQKADFTQAQNFNIDPEKNQLKAAKFSKEGVVGLLYRYDLVII